MKDELKNDIDYENDIDRTIPDGTKGINDEGKKTVFKDGRFIVVEEE